MWTKHVIKYTEVDTDGTPPNTGKVLLIFMYLGSLKLSYATTFPYSLYSRMKYTL